MIKQKNRGWGVSIIECGAVRASEDIEKKHHRQRKKEKEKKKAIKPQDADEGTR